jgi:hypothetical protein
MKHQIPCLPAGRGFGIWNFVEGQIITGDKDIEKASLVEKTNPSFSGSSEGEVDSGWSRTSYSL